MTLKQKIKQILSNSIAKLNQESFFDSEVDLENLNFLITEPNVPESSNVNQINYDFSTNLAFVLKKFKKAAPLEIANKVKEVLESDKNLEYVNVTAPGFINIVVNKTLYSEVIKNIIDQDKSYGSNFVDSKRINVEFVSANPTGFLHVGHVRGAVFGDSLVRILRHAGHKVEAEYYVNDAGNQINILAESIIVRYKELFGIFTQMPEDSYRGTDIIWAAEQIKEKYGDFFLNDYETKINKLKEVATEILLNKIKSDLSKINVFFDTFSSEKKLTENNLIKPVLEKLSKNTYTKDGALFLETTKFGDDKDRVLIKSDGFYTYLTPDIAYHETKLQKCDYLVNIWGADHSGYVDRMRIAIESLGYDPKNLEFLIIQLVRLIKNGEEFKMSKRAGTSVTLADLLDNTSSDAIRFMMLTREINTKYDFDIDEANSKDASNPVFNVQYSHARTVSLLKNLKPYKIDFEANITEKAKKIILSLDEFPELIRTIINTSKVNLLSQYLLNLSNLFNSFYAETKLIGHEYEEHYSSLVLAVQVVFKVALDLIGVNAPETM
ncbi:arginine--tRNA ligase [Mycoplasmopsis edwardii]|uniref:Arginine--tRNA ligase n=1 Tax=Mycoplasmopsis edwardii TaxID=53558 RepID=A0ACD4PHL0_9BACT|nr:arginine--tRNA ligase [Mycoplasmopsis edwardii]WBP84164.1 arginine--tRNA ligase [Mycoplasmopsis edwardii]